MKRHLVSLTLKRRKRICKWTWTKFDTLTLTSASNFPSSGTVFVKITTPETDPELPEFDIMPGTISGTTISSLSREVEGEAVAHVDDSKVELYVLNGIPLTEINKTHTSLDAHGLDYYTLTTTTDATSGGAGGGSAVFATENALVDQLQTLVPVIEHPNTGVTAKVRTTTGTSPSGSQQLFTLASANQAETIPLTDNYLFSQPKLQRRGERRARINEELCGTL